MTGVSLPPPRRGRPPQHVRDLIAFIEHLPAPAGKFIGRPIKLLAWQRRFLWDVYGPREDGRRVVRHAVLSVGRRNGKSLLAAALGLAHLVGPMRKYNQTLLIVANDRDQAGVVHRLASDIVKMHSRLSAHVRPIDSLKRLVCYRTNSTLQAASAAASTKLGIGPDLTIYDEIGNARNRDLYDTLLTAQSSQVEPLMLLLSTQAASDEHFFSELVDYGKRVNDGEIADPTTVLHLYAAAADDDILAESTWRAANPSLGHNRDLGMMRQEAEKIRYLPGAEPKFRNLLLNQRVRAEASFIDPSRWNACAGEPDLDVFRTKPCYGGLDLSRRQDLTALVLVAEDDDGVVHVLCWFWTPDDTLDQRGHRDRAPYRTWADTGTLLTTPGTSIGYDWVATQLGEIGASFDIQAINYDRWRIEELRLELDKLGIELALAECGQGYKDMTPAIEALEHEVLEGRLRHGNHPVLRWCVANAVAQTDPAGGRKLNKAKSFGRIDGAVALAMAMKALKENRDEGGGLFADPDFTPDLAVW